MSIIIWKYDDAGLIYKNLVILSKELFLNDRTQLAFILDKLKLMSMHARNEGGVSFLMTNQYWQTVCIDQVWDRRPIVDCAIVNFAHINIFNGAVPGCCHVLSYESGMLRTLEEKHTTVSTRYFGQIGSKHATQWSLERRLRLVWRQISMKTYLLHT